MRHCQCHYEEEIESCLQCVKCVLMCKNTCKYFCTLIIKWWSILPSPLIHDWVWAWASGAGTTYVWHTYWNLNIELTLLWRHHLMLYKLKIFPFSYSMSRIPHLLFLFMMMNINHKIWNPSADVCPHWVTSTSPGHDNKPLTVVEWNNIKFNFPPCLSVSDSPLTVSSNTSD